MPFALHVGADAASAHVSEVDGYSKEDGQLDEKKGGKPRAGRPATLAHEDTIFAGDIVVVRPQLRDSFGNPAPPQAEDALVMTLEAPGGAAEAPMAMIQHHRGGPNAQEVRYETMARGEHRMHVRLLGEAVKGSPVIFNVVPAAHEAHLCRLKDLPTAPTLHMDEPYTVTLQLVDRFGNELDRGGAVVGARFVYIKQGVYDNTVLNGTNHLISIDDRHDGTVTITLQLMRMTYLPSQINLVVNLDKDPKERPNGIELPPVLLTFSKNPEEQAADELAGAATPAALKRSKTQAMVLTPAADGAVKAKTLSRANTMNMPRSESSPPPGSRTGSPLSADRSSPETALVPHALPLVDARFALGGVAPTEAVSTDERRTSYGTYVDARS